MLHSRTQTLFSVLATLTLIGCRETSPPYGPVTPFDRVPFSVEAVTSIMMSGRPGERAPETPTVVVRDRFGAPVGGIVVTFVADSGGSVDVTTVTTRVDGTATCGGWTLAATERQNTVVATVAQIGSVIFTATVRLAPLSDERYDLLTISGRALPITYGGGGKTWTIIEGHYVFAPNGTFTFWYVSTPGGDTSGRRDSTVTKGTYVRRSASMIAIYFPISPVGTGTIAGDRLSIEYSDWLSWEPEVYGRAR